MSDVQSSDWEQPDIPMQRPDPIRPAPRAVAPAAEKVNLRDYIEFKLAAIDEKNIMRVESLGKELAVALRASETAIEKADRATEKRFESVNEFRQTLTDQTASFVTRQTHDAMERNLLEKIDALRLTMESKIDAQYKIIWTMAGAIAGLQAAIAYLSG